MLHCNMNPGLPPPMMLDLEDVLGSMIHARRADDLGRLALLTYWEVRRWARIAHRDALAARAADLVLHQPHPSRVAFLEIVDTVIDELQRILAETEAEAHEEAQAS